jgi:transposase-like protein
MENTKLSLPTWFAAMFLIVNAKKGISSLQLARDLNINKNSAWYLQKRIRSAMSQSCKMLSGIVEVDETYIGGSMTNMHKKRKIKSNMATTGMSHKMPVLGMLERGGAVKLVVLEKATAPYISPNLKKHINQSSEVVTDGYRPYQKLKNTHAKHIRLNHTKNIRTSGKYHTANIEGFFTTIKRAIIGQYHNIKPRHLQGYMDEIAFKYNNRGKDIFNLLLIRAINPIFANC